MTRPTHPAAPTLASPGRQVFHLIVSIAGWALFTWWWWIVFQRVTAREIRYTGLVIAATLALTVLLTIIWVFHNLRIFRNRHQRTQVRHVREDFTRDRRGREVRFEGGMAALKTAAAVRIEVEGSEKVYLPAGRVREPIPVPAVPIRKDSHVSG